MNIGSELQKAKRAAEVKVTQALIELEEATSCNVNEVKIRTKRVMREGDAEPVYEKRIVLDLRVPDAPAAWVGREDSEHGGGVAIGIDGGGVGETLAETVVVTASS